MEAIGLCQQAVNHLIQGAMFSSLGTWRQMIFFSLMFRWLKWSQQEFLHALISLKTSTEFFFKLDKGLGQNACATDKQIRAVCVHAWLLSRIFRHELRREILVWNDAVTTNLPRLCVSHHSVCVCVGGGGGVEVIYFYLNITEKGVLKEREGLSVIAYLTSC